MMYSNLINCTINWSYFW